MTDMTDTPDRPLEDDDIKISTAMGGGQAPGAADGADGVDSDGTDADGVDTTDSQDADSTDADGVDGTDSSDADSTDQ
jgi:hypothetical protein